MDLVIDIGNTQTKYALFDKEDMLAFSVSQEPDTSLIDNWSEKYQTVVACIVSSVQGRPLDFLSELDSRFEKLIFFDQNTPTPLINLYESKETLGYDRLAACVGANSLCSDTNLLVIDAGSAITFDFVSCKNEYKGGTISAGLSMRFKALNFFTKKLPLLGPSDFFSLVGNSTEQAIVSGVQNSVLFEIEGYINKLKEGCQQVEVFLTGGDSEFLYPKILKDVHLDKNLVLRGLLIILNYNKS